MEIFLLKYFLKNIKKEILIKRIHISTVLTFKNFTYSEFICKHDKNKSNLPRIEPNTQDKNPHLQFFDQRPNGSQLLKALARANRVNQDECVTFCDGQPLHSGKLMGTVNKLSKLSIFSKYSRFSAYQHKKIAANWEIKSDLRQSRGNKRPN